MRVKQKVFLLHSEISPYRLPFFEEFSKNVNLNVYFCSTKSRKRLWNAKTEGYSFQSKVLKFVNIGPMVINYLLPFELLSNSFQVYILDDDPRLNFSKLCAFLFAKLFNKPIIMWSEAIGVRYFNRMEDLVNRFLFVPIRYIVHHYADAYVASGPRAASFLVKNGVSKDKIHTVFPAISDVELKGEIDKYNKSEIKRELGYLGKKVVLFLGYFTKRKGVIELIEVFNNLDRDDAVLVIAGGGKEEKRLRHLAAGRDNIYFPGYVTGIEKAKYYKIADFFVLPTYLDPWGFVIIEAMHFGLPIITTTSNGSGDLVDGNGFLIEPGMSDELSHSIKYLLESDEERKEMGRKSEKIIKEYSVGRDVKTFTNAILSCLNGGAG